MRNGGNITSLWHRIRNLFSCRKHSRRAIDKVWAVKVCVCVCVCLCVCVCVCDANNNEVCTSQVHVSPFPSYPLPRSCQGKDASKISFQFPELFLLQLRIQGYQTWWAMLLNLFRWLQHRKNTYHLRRFWQPSRSTYFQSWFIYRSSVSKFIARSVKWRQKDVVGKCRGLL